MAHSVSLVFLYQKVLKQLRCSRCKVTPSMAIIPLVHLGSSAEMDWPTTLSLSTGRERVSLAHLVAAIIPPDVSKNTNLAVIGF